MNTKVTLDALSGRALGSIRIEMEVFQNIEESARELANDLKNPLETIANVHYLLDRNLLDPAKLLELRELEELAFQAILDKVLPYLTAQ